MWLTFNIITSIATGISNVVTITHFSNINKMLAVTACFEALDELFPVYTVYASDLLHASELLHLAQVLKLAVSLLEYLSLS